MSALALLLFLAQPAGAQGGRIAYEEDDEIYSIRGDGSERQRLTRTPERHKSSSPDYSPDGARIAYSRGREANSIWLLDADGRQRRLTRPSRGASDNGADWHPDGRAIAFTRLRIGDDRITTSLVTVDVATGRERRLKTITTGLELTMLGEPAWSPDGSKLLYSRLRIDGRGRLNPALLVLDVRSGRSTRVAARAWSGTWSPDGTRIAYSSLRHSSRTACEADDCTPGGELYVSDADGAHPVRLTENQGNDSGPAWAPDGRAIVFHSTRNAPGAASYELYSIRPDGGCLTWLTNGVEQRYAPDWQPGSGGVPETLGCGAVPREPTGLNAPPGRGLWLGPVGPGNRLLSTTVDRNALDYSDCTRFEPTECGPALALESGSVCGSNPLRFSVEGDGRFEVRRGALVFRSSDLIVFSGTTATWVFAPNQAVADIALDALRRLPSGDPVSVLEPPRFPARTIARIEEARRLGSVDRIARRMRIGRTRARQLLDLARVLEPLGELKPVRC